MSATFRILTSIFSIFIIHTTAQENLPKYHALKGDGVFSSALKEYSLHLGKVQAVFRVIKTFAKVVDKRFNENHPHACNLNAPEWLENINTDIAHRNLSTLDTICRSRLDSVDRLEEDGLNATFISTVHSKFSSASLAVANSLRKKNSRSPILNDGVEIYPLRNWSVSRGSQHCTVQSAGAFRKDGDWYLRLAVTNHPVNDFLSGPERIMLEEFANEHMDRTLKFRLYSHDGDRRVHNVSTVYSSRSRGRAPWSIVEMTMDENTAIIEALRLTELEVNQAEDALTPSNLAILSLPIVMTFIPLAFIAELNDCATVLYVTFTDLFSVLPLLIKGVELYVTGTRQQGDIAAFHVGNSTFGWLEMWSVQCAGSRRFVGAGIVLIVVSVSAVFIGLLIEYLAWHVMKKRKDLTGGVSGFGKKKGPFGDVYQSDSWLTLDPHRLYEYDYDYEDDSLWDVIEDDDRKAALKKRFGWGKSTAQQ